MTSLELIKEWEGCSLSPYLDYGGVPTIGYGCTHYLDGEVVRMKDPPLTQEEADELCRVMVEQFQDRVDALISAHLSEARMAAVTSLAYNIGLFAFRTSAILKKINLDENDPKIFDEFLRWNKDNGKVVRGLANRRICEAKLYFGLN